MIHCPGRCQAHSRTRSTPAWSINATRSPGLSSCLSRWADPERSKTRTTSGRSSALKEGCAQASMIGLPETVVKVRSPLTTAQYKVVAFSGKRLSGLTRSFHSKSCRVEKRPIILAPFIHDTRHPCLFHYYERNQEGMEGCQLRCCQLTEPCNGHVIPQDWLSRGASALCTHEWFAAQSGRVGGCWRASTTRMRAAD